MQCQRARKDPTSSESPEESSRVLSTKLAALILDTGHNIDVVEHLIEQNITSIQDWAWKKQLRFYSPSESKGSAPRICMADAEFSYTFEYQGNSQRLVHTPLTDKCYLTLTQALQMGLGGNPYGPAGTGKTESVKQLGALFGRLVSSLEYYFNRISSLYVHMAYTFTLRCLCLTATRELMWNLWVGFSSDWLNVVLGGVLTNSIDLKRPYSLLFRCKFR